MSDARTEFNEEKLFALKRTHCGYRICPRCGQKLGELLIDGHQRMACRDDSCGFIFYQNPIPAAGAIIVEQGEILLVRRSHPPRIGDWCIPAGFMEWNEHPSETAVRELEEETGLKVKLNSLFEVYSGSDDPRSNAILILYLAEIAGGEMQAGDDAMEVRFFSFDALPVNIAFEAHLQALADFQKRHPDQT